LNLRIKPKSRILREKPEALEVPPSPNIVWSMDFMSDALAMVEMYLSRCISSEEHEDITEALWGTKVSPGTISNLNKKIHEGILRNGKIFLIKNHYSYVYLDGIWMRVKNVSVLVATVESMERVSGRFPVFLKGQKKTK